MRALIEKIVLKIFNAKAVFILNKTGMWEYIGIPPEISQPIKREDFMKEHDGIPDERINTWWTK